MPRTWSTDLQTIHQAYRRRDTLDLYLNDESELHLSRGAVTRSAIDYENVISSVSELRTSIDSGVDRVTIECQNVDSLLGFNLASGLRLLDYAVGDYGKIYQSFRTPSLVEDIPQVFRGVLANAEASETKISFEFVVDFESLGSIIASRGLGPRCWWRNQNGIECEAVAACSQTRFTCESEKDFGGWEFFEDPASNVPGDGGNDDGGIGTGECFLGRHLVTVPEGTVRLDELQARFNEGKRTIISVDPQNGRLEVDEILEVFESERTGFYTLTFEHGEFHVTRDHPFLVDWNTFRPADQLKRGDTAKTLAGRWFDSPLRRIKWNSDRTEKFYCCRVKKNQTLIVDNFAVHNRSELPF